jgi:uncharacterized membrane protein YphA (DoxX/SURF4 family)
MNSKVSLVIRVLLALFMIVFGANKLFHFMPQPEMAADTPEQIAGIELMSIYMASGFMAIVGILELVAGLALLVGKFIPISLTIIIAIMFNALLFHVLHDPATVVGSAVALVLSLVLLFGYKEKFGTYFNA